MKFLVLITALVACSQSALAEVEVHADITCKVDLYYNAGNPFRREAYVSRSQDASALPA